jgi:thymidylate kinase
VKNLNTITLYEFLKWLVCEFEANDIQYVFMRNYLTLPHKLDSEDIDILVSKNDLIKIENIFWNNSKILIMDQVMRASVMNFFLYGIQVNSKQRSLQIDFNYNCPWKGFEYLSPHDVLERKVIFKSEGLSFCIPDAIDESILSIFTHYIISGEIRERYIEHAVINLTKHKSEATDRLSKHLGLNISKKVIEYINDYNTKGLLSIRKKVCFNIIINNFKRHFCLSVFKNLRHFYKEFTLMYFNRHLFTMTVLGPDGAGKSTVIDSMLQELKSVRKSIVLQHLKPVYFRKKIIKNRGIVTTPHDKKNRGALSSFIKLVTWSLECWVYHLFHKRKNSTIEIFDRHFDDILIDPLRYRCGINKLFVRFFSSIIPRPNLTLVLTAPVEVIQNRKQEVSFDETKRQIEEYEGYASNNKNAFLINTDRPVDEIVKEVLNITIESIHNNSRQVLNK